MATALGIFAVFYSMGAACTGSGVLLAAYGVAVLAGAGFYSGFSKLIKAVVATLLLLAGLLPYGFGHFEWDSWLITAIQIAVIAAFVVLICPTYSPQRGQQRPIR